MRAREEASRQDAKITAKRAMVLGAAAIVALDADYVQAVNTGTAYDRHACRGSRFSAPEPLAPP